MPRIKRLLIPNRGEIALRILRTARALGIECAVAHSDADALGLAARLADRAVRLGPAPPRSSYLSVERIIACARETGCDAVHPGYGFLSEREELARAVEAAGLVYVGPAPENVRLLGDKLAARRALSAQGIAVVPGESEPISSLEALEAAAGRIGYPLLIKAAAGGGGRGIRLVREPGEIAAAFHAAASEARGAFGEGGVFAERYLEGARHVEVQVVGDGHGGVRVFPERDCSLQRRYQKLVEETPSTAVDAELRSRLLATAARVAALARYRGAGTVEFLLAPDGSFHFLEVNTRLQVEHPITEMVTGTDLVAEQLAVAEGRRFSPTGPERVDLCGAALELRVNAEDPQIGFRPSTGRVRAARIPHGPGVRVDTALETGLEVTPYYDSLLAKVIVWGRDRGEAMGRLAAAASEMHVDGVATTLALAAPLLRDPGFRAGRYHTRHLEGLLEDPRFFVPPGTEPGERQALAVVAACLRQQAARPVEGPPPGAPQSPWAREGRARGLRTGERPRTYGGGARLP